VSGDFHATLLTQQERRIRSCSRAGRVLLDCVQNGGSFSLLPARLSVNRPTLTVHMKAATVTSLQQCFDIDFRHPKVIYRGHGLSPTSLRGERLSVGKIASLAVLQGVREPALWRACLPGGRVRSRDRVVERFGPIF